MPKPLPSKASAKKEKEKEKEKVLLFAQQFRTPWDRCSMWNKASTATLPRMKKHSIPSRETAQHTSGVRHAHKIRPICRHRITIPCPSPPHKKTATAEKQNCFLISKSFLNTIANNNGHIQLMYEQMDILL